MKDADKTQPRVAIDGPAGAGKSTVARGLAERLGYVLVDTGAIYRTVALAVMREGIAWGDTGAIGRLAERLVEERAIRLERAESGAAASGSGMRVVYCGEDVSILIRGPEVSVGASRVSAVPAVRAALLDLQRQAGAQGGVVLEGRDIGTVVFPDAEVKFFLTASTDVRARRRFDEDAARGVAVSYEDTLANVVLRDRADSERAVAPLRKADDAIAIDSSGRDVAEIIEEMARTVEARAKGG